MLVAAAAFTVALVASVVLTPLIRVAATDAGFLDEPEARKVHEFPIPRLGGIAIGTAFYIGMAAALVATRAVNRPLDLSTGHLPAILVGVALIGGVGVLDDLEGMRARVKLTAQVLIALVAYGLGLSVDRISGPWGSVDIGPWSILVTVVWIVAVINALNLIDGLDGLASGVAVTAMAALFVIGAASGDARPVLPVLAAGAGGVLGIPALQPPPGQHHHGRHRLDAARLPAGRGRDQPDAAAGLCRPVDPGHRRRPAAGGHRVGRRPPPLPGPRSWLPTSGTFITCSWRAACRSGPSRLGYGSSRRRSARSRSCWGPRFAVHGGPRRGSGVRTRRHGYYGEVWWASTFASPIHRTLD